jgi:hypothetical protein
VRSDDLTCKQAEQIKNVIGPTGGYLYRLRERIDKQGFPKDDPLRLRVEAAHNAMHSLWVELHYMSCASGCGRPDRKRE